MSYHIFRPSDGQVPQPIDPALIYSRSPSPTGSSTKKYIDNVFPDIPQERVPPIHSAFNTNDKVFGKAALDAHNVSMAPAAAPPAEPSGPPTSYIQVAKPFIFEQRLQSHFLATGTNQAREDSIRLQGVTWIDEVRKALQLPVRTFNTAVIYYHKFRLVHRDIEYQYVDAAAAALFTACKIEDTLKKSKDILCAAHNLKVSPSEHLTPDDSTFDMPSKTVIGLERLMLEASGFDYRNRHPQKYLIKLARVCNLDKSVARNAYDIMLDLYRTFAPLKQTSSTMCFACLDLSTRLLSKQTEHMQPPNAPRYSKWRTSRAEVMETMLDLLDLYTHFQKNTVVGPSQNIEKFISIRIALNQEAEEARAQRYTEWAIPRPANGGRSHLTTPATPATPASPAEARLNGNAMNGHGVSPLSPRSGSSGRKAMQEGTVRFMLDGERAKKEKETIAEYSKVEYEDYEIEVEEQVPPSNTAPNTNSNGRSHPRDRDRDRPFEHRGPGGYHRDRRNRDRDDWRENKRMRR